VLALSTEAVLPSEVMDFGRENGFVVTKKSVGEGVKWSSGVVVGTAAVSNTRNT
jgi:homoserine kinase